MAYASALATLATTSARFLQKTFAAELSLQKFPEVSAASVDSHDGEFTAYAQQQTAMSAGEYDADLAAIRAAYAKENGLPPPAKAFDFWTLLNVVAWIGWSCVLASAAYDAKLVLILELMCCAELLRMVVGVLKGNVRVGLILHATRLIVYHQVLPTHYTTQILQVWSVTELARYPYYVFKSPLTFALRSFVPLITFPLGVVAETLGLVARLRDDDASTAVKCLCALPLVTTLLAPIGYWSLLKKAVRADRKSVV